MKFIFTKNIVAFGENHKKDEIIDIEPDTRDAKFCIDTGLLVHVQDNLVKRIIKRKKKNEPI
jgi:NAD-dependent SIR2 family protein deacetylase